MPRQQPLAVAIAALLPLDVAQLGEADQLAPAHLALDLHKPLPSTQMRQQEAPLGGGA
jgi:hypothetical protein